MTNTITHYDATKEFGQNVRVGEYVAWWVSNDGDATMNAVTQSYPTEDECEQAFAEEMDDSYLADLEGRTLRETGEIRCYLVIADE